MTTLGVRWLIPPANLLLGPHEAHVWRAWLDLPAPRIQALEQTLTADERGRASRFRFQTDRTRFIVARATLRALLGRYLNREPDTLRFSYSEYGKPALAEEGESDPLLFNVSHSHQMALYAFTRSGDIGIDLEQISTDTRDYQDIARRFFSPAEVQELLSVPAKQRQEAFLNCWTRKEAYIKARGLGLSLILSQFDVSLTPGAPAALLATREKGQEQSAWSLYAIAPGPGYIGALAVKAHPTAITCWQATE